MPFGSGACVILVVLTISIISYNDGSFVFMSIPKSSTFSFHFSRSYSLSSLCVSHRCLLTSSFKFCKDSFLVPLNVAFVDWFGLATNIDSSLHLSLLGFLFLPAPWFLFINIFLILPVLLLVFQFLFYTDWWCYLFQFSKLVSIAAIEFNGSFSSFVLISVNRSNMILSCFLHLQRLRI